MVTSAQKRWLSAGLARAPGTIAVNVTWIEREFNAGQTHLSMYPSIFNRFPVIQAVKSKGGLCFAES